MNYFSRCIKHLPHTVKKVLRIDTLTPRHPKDVFLYSLQIHYRCNKKSVTETNSLRATQEKKYSQAELALLTRQSFSHLKRCDPIFHSSQTFLSSLNPPQREIKKNQKLGSVQNMKGYTHSDYVWYLKWFVFKFVLKRCFPYLLVWRCLYLFQLLSQSVHNGKSMVCLLMISKQLYNEGVFFLPHG